MKNKAIKTKLLTVLLTLCMILSLVPFTAFAAAPATQTADFTVGRGEAAIKLLNEYRTGTADSLWDNNTKTLTLWGVNFTTTAQTAVKLPVGSTIVLKDGTHNTIQSGDVALNASGQHKNQIFINALDAAGSLTIQGETKGTGTLSVYAGKVTNEGDAWTFSSGISVYGDFTVKGGHVTARGGYIEGKDSVFSIGVNMDNDIKNKALLVTGGSLSAIAGESYEIQNDGSKRAVFSRGVYLYRGNVIVSGDGKLRAESVEKMSDGGVLSDGLYVSSGNLTVSNSAEVAVAGAYGAYISGGSLALSGGKLTAVSTQTESTYGNALDVEVDKNVADSGNITVTGGTLETSNGAIYVSTYGATENQGVFAVTGGTIVNRDEIQGSGLKLNISGGSIQTRSVDVGTLNLSGGTLTVREPVRKIESTGRLYANPAVDVSTLTVSGGTLDAAWDWGNFDPIVFSEQEDVDYAAALVKMPYEFHKASFTGGTTLLDTGIAGNTALLIKGTLTLGDDMEETGADANHCQLRSDTPVKIAVAATPTAVENVTLDYENISYKAGDTPRAAASVSGGNCTVAYECWTEIRQSEGGGQWYETGRRWYSDSDKMAALPADERIINFEAGNSYQYSVVLVAGNGYSFSNDETVVSVGEDEWGTPGNHKKLEIKESGKELHIKRIYTFDLPNTSQPITITSAHVENAKFDYKPGDAPRATATVAAADQGKYRISNEYWQELDENNVPVAAWYSDGGAYSTLPTITAFKSGKKYVYAVMLLPERGYTFSSGFAATVNGNAVTAVPAADGYLSLPNVKTITPTEDFHTHSYGTNWKSDTHNHWYECACGDKADIAAHTFKWVIDNEATTTEKGSKHEECTVCGYKKAAVDIPATGSGNGSANQPDKPGDNSFPQTGDNSLALWFAVLFISGGVFVVFFVKKLDNRFHIWFNKSS